MSFLQHWLWLATLSIPVASRLSNCRCFPGDECWPEETVWQHFNSSINGNLVRTFPVARVCHDPHYDAGLCEALRKSWQDPVTHYQTTHSPMQPYFANQSCDPFSARIEKCTIGAYVQYAVNVSTAEDVTKTIQFCEEHDIRFVIRNTGHDYLGKSTAPGAVAIWMHNLKSVEMMEWSDVYYSGKALKMAAGVQASESIKFAAKHGQTVVTGNCPTVGVAGGYIAGGGHSPLSSKYGLAADQTLEFEVIDGRGQYLIANRTENSDLYWALSGGGGGTYAVVLSVTVKTYPDLKTTMATLEIASSQDSEDNYWDAILSWNTLLPDLYRAGCSLMWSWSRPSMRVYPLTCPGSSVRDVEALLGPYFTSLKSLGIPYRHQIDFFDKYSDWHSTTWSSMEETQAGIIQGGSWFIPEDVITNDMSHLAFIDVAKKIIDNGEILSFLGFKPLLSPGIANSVFPGWRNLAIHCWVVSLWNNSAPWSQMLSNMERTSTVILPLLQGVAPHGGTYLSEATYLDENWKKNFYGTNYDRLLTIKQKYDPKHVFYGITTVGSDLWAQQVDGRLCRTPVNSPVREDL